MSSTTYLDYAATSAVRPPQVAEAVASYLRDVGATPGRATHSRSLQAGRLTLRCRQLLAHILGIPGDPGRIAMQMNATHALNTAIYGVLEPGDVVVRTSLDHNAVRRPVSAMTRFGITERVLTCDPSGSYDPSELESLLTSGDRAARLFVVPHASNVTGAVLPVAEMAALARETGTLTLIDAAQTAGHYPIAAASFGADMIAFTGHKGLLGPQGTGGLWVREGVQVAPLLRGGTGGDSSPRDMPDAYPDHLEAGTQNAPGIAGLAAAIEWLLDHGPDRIREEEMRLKARLLDRLRAVPGVRILSPDIPESVGIVTLTLDGWTPGELSTEMDRRFGIQGRAGLHCAPDAHATLGTLESGAYRLSIGWDTRPEDVDRAADAIRTLSQEK
jgi:cysteine desulfurase/selenocysteine lyase